MAYLLDTNIAIHATEGHPGVLQKLLQHETSVLLSALCFAKLQRGIHRHASLAPSRRVALELLLRTIPVIPFDAMAAEAYGRIIALCGWAKGKDFDRMIAAHAISVSAILVTDNTAAFKGIPGLSLENWARA